MADLSVVIPCFNGASYVHEAIESVLDQMDRLEVIVVDDGSTDGSAEIASSYGEPVRVVRLDRNSGVVGAVNAGIGSAQAPLVMILDADDLLLPGAVPALAGAAAAHPDIAVFIPDVDIVDFSTGDVIYEVRHVTPFLDLHRILAYEIPPTAGRVFRREVLAAHPYRPITDGTWVSRSSEDWQHWLELAAADVQAMAVPDAHGLYRTRPTSLSRNVDRKWRSGNLLLADPRFRHPNCEDCEKAAARGRAALRDYCFAMDLVQVFGPGPRRFARALGTVRRDPALTPRLAYAAAWRLRDKLLRRGS